MTCENTGGRGGQGRGRTADLPILDRIIPDQAHVTPAVTATTAVTGRDARTLGAASGLLTDTDGR
jgi:hypothetical protein